VSSWQEEPAVADAEIKGRGMELAAQIAGRRLGLGNVPAPVSMIKYRRSPVTTPICGGPV
jgi:hypothetical protein